MKNNLRQATSNDIIEGAIIWVDGDDELVKFTIDKVLRPSDMFKAYVADDGCRYGLDESYVETKYDGDFDGNCT